MRIFRFLVLLLLLPQLGCGLVLQGIKSAGESSTPKVLTTHDKRLQVTVPGNWVQNDKLHEDGDLGAEHRVGELYMVLLDESKADFDGMTLKEHSDLTLGIMKENLANVDLSEPKSLTINGCPALQYVVKGSMDKIKIVFIHTTIETKSSFCQMLTWTLGSEWDQNQVTLYKVIDSFQDLEEKKP
jgi:hypothetical protein